jgi:hypothetical protein
MVIITLLFPPNSHKQCDYNKIMLHILPLYEKESFHKESQTLPQYVQLVLVLSHNTPVTKHMAKTC